MPRGINSCKAVGWSESLACHRSPGLCSCSHQTVAQTESRRCLSNNKGTYIPEEYPNKIQSSRVTENLTGIFGLSFERIDKLLLEDVCLFNVVVVFVMYCQWALLLNGLINVFKIPHELILIPSSK